MPETGRLNEATLASMLKGSIGERHRYHPVSFDMPDEKTLAILATWTKKAAIQASAMGGIGYALHRTASVEGVTKAYLLMEYARKDLAARKEVIPNLETLGKLAVVASVVLFIWGEWGDRSIRAAGRVVPDYLGNATDYTLASGVFPFTTDVMKASVPLGRRITKKQ